MGRLFLFFVRFALAFFACALLVCLAAEHFCRLAICVCAPLLLVSLSLKFVWIRHVRVGYEYRVLYTRANLEYA